MICLFLASLLGGELFSFFLLIQCLFVFLCIVALCLEDIVKNWGFNDDKKLRL
jgi:hypothetical protein